jgi:hypothetical protein
MARYAAGRLDRLVIGGQHPYARSMVGLRQAVQAGLAHGVETFVAEMGMGEFKSEYAMRLCSTDMKAFLALAQDRPRFENNLRKRSYPFTCVEYTRKLQAKLLRNYKEPGEPTGTRGAASRLGGKAPALGSQPGAPRDPESALGLTMRGAKAAAAGRSPQRTRH